MATPSCPKCGNTTFEMKEVKVTKATFRHNAVICSSCGAIVFMEDVISTMHSLGQIKEKLGIK